MIRVFLFLFFLIISNKAIATVMGEALICDKDKRGYNFVTKDEVEVLHINFKTLNIISINHFYQLAQNAILIKKPLTKFNRYKKTKLIGWIFRRTLDYVSLEYKNGDWSRKFLWSCEIISSDLMEQRLKNKIDKLLNSSGNKSKNFK